MDANFLKIQLKSMSQDEVLSYLQAEVRNAKSLKSKVDKSAKAEMATLFQKRTTANAWNNSEQYEKSKECIRIIASFLI